MTVSILTAKTLNISDDVDVAYAALGAKQFAREIGFLTTGQCMISTAVSELARNILVYAERGTINLNLLEEDTRRGIEVVAEDAGPGIEDLEKAMEDNFSTAGTMGVGLPGTRRIMDEFQIDTCIAQGTRVTVRKWI